MKTRRQSEMAGEERRRQRPGLFQAAKKAHASHSRKSGYYAIGRDSSGAAVETRRLQDLRIIVDQWYVRMSFKREDGEKLGNDWKKVEEKVKEGKVPRKLVKMDTHIIPAVRALKHVRQGYQEELENTDTVLRLLDAINLDAARKCGSITNEDIDSILSALDALDYWLSKKQVALKRVVSRARLAKTKEMFEQAREKKGAHVARACAVFTSLRNRLGSWRDRQVAGIAEYNYQRECALRPERDQWLFSRLTVFAEAAEQIARFQMYDEHKKTVIGEARRMMTQGEPTERILRYLEANKDLFRVSKRERERAEANIFMMENGKMPKGGGTKVDYLIGHYAWLYRHVRDGEKAKALAKLDYLDLFVKANKPNFIADELADGPEPYLENVIDAMLAATYEFNQENYGDAKLLFAEAAEEMGKIVYPRGVPK